MKRWAILVTTPERIFPAEVSSSRGAMLGRGKGSTFDLKDPAVSERHAMLAVRDDVLMVEPVRGAAGVTVNEISVLSATPLATGDELGLGRCRIVVMGPVVEERPRVRLAGHDELLARLEEELRRARGARPVGLLLVELPALNAPARQALTRRLVDDSAQVIATWAEYAPNVLACLVPEVGPAPFAALVASLAQTAGARAKVVSARSPDDGLDAELLIEVAMARLGDDERASDDALFVDAGMVRLASAARDAAERGLPVLVSGPPGSGRSTLVQTMAKSVGASLVRFASLSDVPTGWALLPDAEQYEPEQLSKWVHARTDDGTQVCVTAQRVLPGFTTHFSIPPLAARMDEVLPLAEAFLAQARTRINRPRLFLGPEARALLLAYRWPGHVRELRNVMIRSARAAVRDEVGRDALPVRLASDAPVETLRGALAATERELLLEALARTRWNVTSAAQRLGLPRRTVVYRMAKLGLRRPAK